MRRRIIAAGEDGSCANAGLTGRKIRYALALAEAGIDYPALARCDRTPLVIETSVTRCLRGRWSNRCLLYVSCIYWLLFAVTQARRYPAQGDLALLEAGKNLF